MKREPTLADYDAAPRWQPLAAGASVVGLWLALTLLNPHPIVDEILHAAIIERFARGDWRWPEELPMPPTYHAAAALLARATGDALLAGRTLSALCALGTIALAAGLQQRLTPRGHPDMSLHVAWCPAFFPLTALAYTDAAGLLGVVAGVYCHERRWRPAAAACLVVATAVRQSNVVWIALLLAWAVVDAWRGQRPDAGAARGGTRGGSRGGMPSRPLPLAGRRLTTLLDAPAAAKRFMGVALRAGWAYLLALALIGLGLAQLGSLTLGRESLNMARFNLAQFYLFGLFTGAALLPVWLGALRRGWRDVYRPALGRAWCWALAVALAALIATQFANPHPWNRERWVLSNVPLLLLEHWPAVLWAAAAALAALLPLAVGFTATQPRCGRLVLVWAFALLFLAPHWAACARYYVVPLALVSVEAVFAERIGRSLTVWCAAASAALATVLVFAGSEKFGVW